MHNKEVHEIQRRVIRKTGWEKAFAKSLKDWDSFQNIFKSNESLFLNLRGTGYSKFKEKKKRRKSFITQHGCSQAKELITQSHFVLEIKEIQEANEHFIWVHRAAVTPCKKEVRLLCQDLILSNNLQTRRGQN